jgi:hypothetical protein
MHVCMSAVDVQHVGHCPLHTQGHVGHKQACQHYPSDQLVSRLEVLMRPCLCTAYLFAVRCIAAILTFSGCLQELFIDWCTVPRSRASAQHASRLVRGVLHTASSFNEYAA